MDVVHLHAAPGDSAVPPSARQRILEVADRLFYEEGIRAVGVDRIIAESRVSKATFYKHFTSKDILVAEYLRARNRVARVAVASQVDARSPRDALIAGVGAIIREIDSPGFRGSPFANAAAEYPDAHHAVRHIVVAHREWLTETTTTLLRRVGHPLPGDGADDLLLAVDGALLGGYAGDPVSAVAALQRTLARVLSEAPAEDAVDGPESGTQGPRIP